MNNQPNSPLREQSAEEVERRDQANSTTRLKKQFIEPVVSVPVDVLEATSYFAQLTTVTSTATN